MTALLWGLWAAVNLAAFALYGADKRRARRGEWRVPERTLLLCAWLMGGVGAWLGMRAFHHKTRHRRFAAGVPIAAALQIALMAWASVRLMG